MESKASIIIGIQGWPLPQCRSAPCSGWGFEAHHCWDLELAQVEHVGELHHTEAMATKMETPDIRCDDE